MGGRARGRGARGRSSRGAGTRNNKRTALRSLANHGTPLVLFSVSFLGDVHGRAHGRSHRRCVKAFVVAVSHLIPCRRGSRLGLCGCLLACVVGLRPSLCLPVCLLPLECNRNCTPRSGGLALAHHLPGEREYGATNRYGNKAPPPQPISPFYRCACVMCVLLGWVNTAAVPRRYPCCCET